MPSFIIFLLFLSFLNWPVSFKESNKSDVFHNGNHIMAFITDANITMGSLNADILRYNADNLSITQKLWGKLDENVSWVITFPSHSPIYLHFTRQNLAYRVTTVSMLATAPMLSAHIVLSRGNGCHKCATTLILWGQRQFWGNLRFHPG